MLIGLPACGKTGLSEEFAKKLQAEGLGISVHFIPIFNFTYWKELYPWFTKENYPNASEEELKLIMLYYAEAGTYSEVSRRTGGAIAEALREKGYNAVEVELVPEKLVEQLREIDAKVVFNAVHGMYGEDGRLQSILEAIKMPYTGSGVLASAVAMDKNATKRFLLSANISTPKCLMYNRRYDKDVAKIEKEIIETFGVPVVIKAADQGSSIGVEIVKAEADVATALENVFKYSDMVLVEECINGKELTCGVMEVEGELKALHHRGCGGCKGSCGDCNSDCGGNCEGNCEGGCH